MLPNHPWSVSLNSQILPARILWQFLQISRGTEIVLGEKVLCGSENSSAGYLFLASHCGHFLGNFGSRHRLRHCVCAGAHILVQLMPKWPQLAPCGTSGEKLTVLGDFND